MATTPSVSGNTQTQRKPMDRFFIGKAWKNTVKVKGKDVEMMNILIDKKKDAPIILNNINDECQFQLWPNDKREGKRDADFRVSLLSPKVS